MALLPPNELLHLGPDPAGASWNHFDLGLGLSSHINYPQAQLGNTPPQGAPWFYSKLNSAGVPCVQFSAPLSGATTSTNTEYARCELREYERDGTTKMAFDPRSDDHWIEGIYRITGLGTDKRGLCVQQAHDPGDDVIMVRTENNGSATGMYLNYNGTRVATLTTNYVLGTEFYLKIRVNAGTPSVYYTTNLSSIPTTPFHTSAGFFSGANTGWYFKSGCYNQSNESTDPNLDPDASIIKVEIRELKHWHSATPKGGAWPTPATYATVGSPTADAGADAQILPSTTFSRTGAVTLNGATLTSQQWKILSGPLGVGNVLSSTGTVSWNPNTGTTSAGTTTRGLGVGGIARPAAASNVELNSGNRGDMNITASGTALVPRIYDGGGFTCGRVTVSANYIVVQNYNVRPNSQYGVYITGSNVTIQNCDIKDIKVSGDGDLNCFTLLEGSNIDILYNTAINYVTGDPGDSHTDWIQTWVSSSHSTPVNNVRVIGNKATGPSNPGRDNGIASIHQIIMVESAGHGGNSGGSGTPSNWTILDNEFGDSWGQAVKTDCGNNFVFARNKWVGSSDKIFSFDCGTGNVVYSSNIFGSGYGSVGASTTAGDGPANPISGGSDPVTTPYPLGSYVLEYSAVTSAGTVTDTVTVLVTNTPSTPGGGGTDPGTPGTVAAYPSFGAKGVATADEGNSMAVAAPPGAATGQFQICVIQCSAAETMTTVPAGWFLLDEQAVDNTDLGQPAGPSKAWVYYNTTGDTSSRTWVKSGIRGFQAIRMFWKDYSALGEHFPRGSSYTTTPYSSVVDPATPKALVVSILGSDRSDIGPQPVSVPGGWTSRHNDSPTVSGNEIQTIAVADIQSTDMTATGGNAPGGTGNSSGNFTLTNADNCSMFSFVLEGVLSSGVITPALVTLPSVPKLTAGTAVPPVPPGGILLTTGQSLLARSFLRGASNLLITALLQVNPVVFPRGAFIILPNITVGAGQQLARAFLELIASPTLRAGALPYRRPVIRTDYKYPPKSHPFRLIAQRILDGEIVEWELPVDNDFEYVEQLSGPVVMKGSFRPEIISVQELGLDGYAYWLHVEVNQEIRASAILLPPQYEESAMSFSAEGVTAVPHYNYYNATLSYPQVDPLSVVRMLWIYVQSQPQSDYGVVVSNNSSPILLGELARTDVTTNDDGSQTITEVPAKPYEINWWDGTNVGEEIDSLAGQTPFDYVERHAWNADKTDVLHYVDLGYPRLGTARKDLLFNEENILEVVPIQEPEDTYASAVLVIGAGDGADTIRAYRELPYGDRIRKEVVITDKTITTVERAQARADQELAYRRGRAFEAGEIIINSYHTNAPTGSYRVGDDIQVQIEVPWLMIIHTAWYRITSITTKPSSDKVRIGLQRSANILDSSEQWIQPDDYVPFEPTPTGAPTNWKTFITLTATPSLILGGTVIPAVIGGVTLMQTPNLTVSVIALRSGSVTMVVGKTLTANGVATVAGSSSVSLIVGKTLVVGAAAGLPALVSLISGKTLTVGASPVVKIGAVLLGGVVTGFGADPFGSVPFGDSAATPMYTLTVGTGVPVAAVSMSVGKALAIGASVQSDAAVSLTVGKSLSVGGTQNAAGAVSMTVGKTLTAGGTVTSSSTTVQMGKQTDGTGSSTSSANKTIVSKFTASNTGNITGGHARLWIDTGSASVQMCVYSDSSGTPSSLVALSDAITLSGTTEAQRDFTFSGAQQFGLTTGTDYWVGFTWPDPGTPIISWSRDTTAGQAQQNSLNAASSFGTPGTALSGPIDAFLDVLTSGGGGGGGTNPVIRSIGTGGKASVGDATVPCTKPAGLAVGDYMLLIHGADADAVLADLTATGYGTLGSVAGGGASNYPAGKVFGKVATSTDVAASSFTFGSSTAADSAVVLVAIQTGTYNSLSPVTFGTWTTQARISTMTQTAPSMTGVVNGLLLSVFITDTNNTVEAYPSTGPSGTTFVGYAQGTPHYAMTGVYSQVLASTSATGTKSVSPTPSGITTNGWATTSLIINPA